jgi:hypothetical protein
MFASARNRNVLGAKGKEHAVTNRVSCPPDTQLRTLVAPPGQNGISRSLGPYAFKSNHLTLRSGRVARGTPALCRVSKGGNHLDGADQGAEGTPR